jgi:hypothetical protein
MDSFGLKLNWKHTHTHTQGSEIMIKFHVLRLVQAVQFLTKFSLSMFCTECPGKVNMFRSATTDNCFNMIVWIFVTTDNFVNMIVWISWASYVTVCFGSFLKCLNVVSIVFYSLLKECNIENWGVPLLTVFPRCSGFRSFIIRKHMHAQRVFVLAFNTCIILNHSVFWSRSRNHS